MAVFLALLAAGAFALGTVLQQKGTLEAPAADADPPFLRSDPAPSRVVGRRRPSGRRLGTSSRGARSGATSGCAVGHQLEPGDRVALGGSFHRSGHQPSGRARCSWRGSRHRVVSGGRLASGRNVAAHRSRLVVGVYRHRCGSRASRWFRMAPRRGGEGRDARFGRRCRILLCRPQSPKLFVTQLRPRPRLPPQRMDDLCADGVRGGRFRVPTIGAEDRGLGAHHGVEQRGHTSRQRRIGHHRLR